MVRKIQSIETRYKGFRFRSRLEARWGVFFSALDLSWEYEPEGFVLSTGVPYLPDFRVYSPQGRPVWYEVKPAHKKADGKLSTFWKDQEDYAVLLSGDPYEFLFNQRTDQWPTEKPFLCPRCGMIGTPSVWFSGNEVRVDCRPCDMETPSGVSDQELGVCGIQCQPHKGQIDVDSTNWNSLLFHITEAQAAARSARFEHGETPR